MAREYYLACLNLSVVGLCCARSERGEKECKKYSDAYKEIVAKAKHIKELKVAKESSAHATNA